MELSMLKDLFFVGEEQAIDEFIAGLKARCIKNGDIRVAVTPAGEERVLYNSENNTYFSQRMYVLKKDPVSGSLEVAEDFVEAPIAFIQRRQKNGPGSRFVNTENVSQKVLNEGTFLVPEITTGRYLYMDNANTTPVVYRDGEEAKAGWIDIRNRGDYGITFRNVSVYDNIDEEWAAVDTAMLFDNSVVKPVRINSTGSTVYCTEEYCQSREDLIGQCSDCGSYWLKSLLTEDGTCPFCDTPLPIDRYHSHRYHEVLATGQQKTSQTVFLGAEFESHHGYDRNTRAVKPLQNLFHCERDGSLGYGGFETISEKMSWEAWVENHAKICEMLQKLYDLGQRADGESKCGLHVHINAEAFIDRDAIDRANLMVSGFELEMQKLARRRGGHYCEYANVSRAPKLGDLKMFSDSNRYQVLNTSNIGSSNKNTVEVRAFQGTLDGETAYASLEFCKNLAEVANSKKSVVKFGDLIYGDFLPAFAEKCHINKEAKMDFRRFNIQKTLDEYEAESVDQMISDLREILDQQEGE